MCVQRCTQSNDRGTRPNPKWASGKALAAVVGVLALVSGPAVATASSIATSSGATVAREFNTAAAKAGASSVVAADASVTIPSTGTEVMSVRTADGNVGLSVPGQGLGDQQGATTVFDGIAADTQVGVQATEGGVRALVRIDGGGAPEEYRFKTSGLSVALELAPDGTVLIRNQNAKVVAWVHAPWARDAKGAMVPTHYEVKGDTLTQVVEHRARAYAYPIVADPFLAPNCVTFSRSWITGYTNVYNRCGYWLRVKAVLRFQIDTSCKQMSPGERWGFNVSYGVDRLEAC